MKKEYHIWFDANSKYSQCKSCTMISSFVVWACVILVMLFPVFGFGLGFFVMCFLCIGFKNNVLDCLQDKPIKVENVFNYYKHCISAFCLKVCSLALTLLWSLLFIVPGIITGLNYSFAPYIFSEQPSLGTLECLNKSKQLTYSHRAELFILYLTQALFVTLVLVLCFSLITIFNYIVTMPLWFNITLPIFVTLLAYFVVIFPYFEMIIANLYLNSKNLNTQKKSKQKSKSISKDK